MKYFGGCDVGSTYTKCVILDENGKMVADVTNRSKINPVQSAEIALNDAMKPFLISKIGLETLHENLSGIRIRQVAAINLQINLRDGTLKSTSTRTMRT